MPSPDKSPASAKKAPPKSKTTEPIAESGKPATPAPAKAATAKAAETTTPAPAKAAAAKTSEPAKAAEPAPKAAAKGVGKASAPTKVTLTPADRMKMIAEAAYYLAQKRGFGHGQDLSDWVVAEQQVDTQLAKRG